MSSARDRLAALQLPGTIHFGAPPSEPVRRLPTGVEGLDALLGGGFPRGHLSEIVGRASSGRTTVLFALLAAATRAGEVVALVDLPDALDPASLAGAGAQLERVLWVRPPSAPLALKCAELILAAGGFGVVALDLDAPRAFVASGIGVASASDAGRRFVTSDDDPSRPRPGPRASRPPAAPLQNETRSRPRRLAPATWQRLAQAARRAGAAAVILAPRRLAGADAALAITLTQRRAYWSAGLFDGVAAQVEVTRSRFSPAERSVLLALGEQLAALDGVSVGSGEQLAIEGDSAARGGRHRGGTRTAANRWERRRQAGRGDHRVRSG